MRYTLHLDLYANYLNKMDKNTKSSNPEKREAGKGETSLKPKSCPTSATPRTAALQAPLSRGFPAASCTAGKCFTAEPPGKPSIVSI